LPIRTEEYKALLRPELVCQIAWNVVNYVRLKVTYNKIVHYEASAVTPIMHRIRARFDGDPTAIVRSIENETREVESGQETTIGAETRE
jgi:hypothetical protein